MITPAEIEEKLEIPPGKSFVPVRPMEGKFMYDLIREKKITRTAETGLAFGRSACYMLAATGSTHVAIDPFQDADFFGSLGLKNVKALGLDQQLEFYPDFSHNAFPKLLKEGRRFEFIFIDGDHRYEGAFLDFYYATQLLDKNGYVLFHDTWLRAIRLIKSYIRKNRKDFKYVRSRMHNMAIFQKVSDDDSRPPLHFREFYTFRSILSQNLNTWTLNPKRGWVRRWMERVRGIFRKKEE